MPAQVKRFQPQEEESNKVRQLSSLFNIIGNNLLLAFEILGSGYSLSETLTGFLHHCSSGYDLLAEMLH